MSEIVVVTGATGLLGNNVVRALVERGMKTRAVVRSHTNRRELEQLDVEQRLGDIRDADSLLAAFRGATAVIHCAADVRVGRSMSTQYRETNTVGTQHVARCARNGRLRLIHVSTVNCLAVASSQSAVDETTPLTGREINSNYVLTKRRAEHEVMCEIERGLDGVIVNPGFMLGPWDWKPSSGQMMLAIATRWSPLAPAGGCSVCDARDVAHGILAALKKGEKGRRYILSGHNVTYVELWRRMARVAEVRPPLARLGPVASWVGGRMGDLWGRFSQNEPVINSASVAMSNQFHYYSSQLAEREFGYHYRSLDGTIRDAWDWLLRHGYLGRWQGT